MKVESLLPVVVVAPQRPLLVPSLEIVEEHTDALLVPLHTWVLQ